MKSCLFILWVIWGLLAIVLNQIIGHISQDSQAYLWCAAGLLIGFLYSCFLLLEFACQNDSNIYRLGILFLTLVVHFSFWCNNPIKEDDYFRYSWDGRNSRMGEHPYLHAPQDYFSKEVPEYSKSINFPKYRTIYPPIAQVFFLSETLYPNTIYGWWIFILLIDFIFVILTWLYLKREKIHWHYFAIIWLNPIWLKEGLNSGHIDIIAAFLIWLAIYFSSKKLIYSTIFSALSAGIRPWLGVFLFISVKEKSIKKSVLFILIIILPWFILFSIPSAPTLSDAMSSWKIFINRWEFNGLFYDFFYRINIFYNGNSNIARCLGWVLGILLMIFIYWKNHHKSDTLFWGSLGATVWILFQPTVNAWYFLSIIGASSAYLLFNNLNEKHYKGVLAACSIALPLSYMNYLDINRDFLDYKWALCELLLLILTYLLFVLPTKKVAPNI